jgi:hypothetical protein
MMALRNLRKVRNSGGAMPPLSEDPVESVS